MSKIQCRVGSGFSHVVISNVAISDISCKWILLYILRLLTGIKIIDIESAKAAMSKLHDMGASTVVISSSELGQADTLVALASTVLSKYPDRLL